MRAFHRGVRGALVLLATIASSAFATDLGDGLVRLRVASWDARSGPPPPAVGSARAVALAPEDRGAWIVAFEGPADAWIRGAIEETGARIAGYVPSGAYLVRARSREAARLRTVDGILRVDRYRPEWKISPEIGNVAFRTPERIAEGDRRLLLLQVFDDASPEGVSERARGLGVEPIRVWNEWGVRRVLVRADPELVEALARIPEVEWIEEAAEVTPRNDDVAWVIQSNQPDQLPLADHGLLGEGEIFGHIDGALSLTSCFFLDPAGTPVGPDHRKIVGWRQEAGDPSADFHGTHTAGTLAGDQSPVNGFFLYQGMAPLARISHTSYYSLDGEYNGQPSNLRAMFEAAHADGARIHSNSWGSDAYTSYISWCLDSDAFARDNEEDLVLFAITNNVNAGVKVPENAKNVVSTYATAGAPNQAFHSRGGFGPTLDGRRKPDVGAPGEATRSAATSACATTTSTGTSMSCPAVAGGAGLVREYFRKGYFPGGTPRASNALVPTGALLKAVLVNSAVDLLGIAGYPTASEGWGRVRLDDALFFPGDVRRLWFRDVRHAGGLATGEVRAWTVPVTGSSEPLAVTLVYTDQPGTQSAAVWTINDLDLEVVAPDGTVYLGNRIDPVTGQSIPGGAADPIDPVERALIGNPSVGDWRIRVRGTSIPDGPQGFAVVINGEVPMQRVPTRAPAPDPPGLDGRGDTVADVTLGPFLPNPFRGAVEIRYTLPERAPVRIEVFDVRGKLVRVLLDRPVAPGEHRAEWDGRDESGFRAAPGIYFTRLETGGRVETAKGVMLR